MIDLEVKEFGGSPDASQRDIAVMKHQLIMQKGRNIHGCNTVVTRKLKSTLSGSRVSVRYMGFHLLQFEKTNPKDSKWIKWDHRPISESQLVGLLKLELDPYNPDRKLMELLRDRHAKRPEDLFKEMRLS